MTELPPIHREVLVDADPAIAFEVFTERIAAWWPLEKLSVFGAGTTVAFEDGEIVETSADGNTAIWGTVTAWDPPNRIAFTWHPGHGAERATDVLVRFVARGDATLVVLEHSGWERLADPTGMRDEYGRGWPGVLASYAELVPNDADARHEEEPTFAWAVLVHRSRISSSVFEDRRFAEHTAFLRRRAEAGELIAAGPMPDGDGEGMTVLRIAEPGGLERAQRLATQDDLSVVEGLFDVTVRPWRVVMVTV